MQSASGQTVRRGEALGTLAAGATSRELTLAATLGGRAVTPTRYLLGDA